MLYTHLGPVPSEAQLRREFKPAEVTAVCLCLGNRRGMFEPHVPGVEWGVGAMGNARWRGVRLKDVLAKAGVKVDALEAVFDGADRAALDKTPDSLWPAAPWRRSRKWR